MANQVLRNVMKDLESVKFLTLMADETTDISSRKQLVICLRYIDDQSVPHEIFVGFYTVDDIKADVIISAITDTLTRFNIPFNKYGFSVLIWLPQWQGQKIELLQSKF